MIDWQTEGLPANSGRTSIDQYFKHCSDEVEVMFEDGSIKRGYYNYHVMRWFIHGFYGVEADIKSWRYIKEELKNTPNSDK